ncbi:tripartite ATP-independent transporter solute receptor, DctP family [Limimonas halophila]|uniref:Tripartite ATP-independent transporter solute receptor, DctP family n=1 Tax=Limimonas halophila TaxID=1082479 RepID=A0A1G7LL16_9PROT|nr:TRAP transporter substrate-binding protein DctP [Limimonas halophila]SDF50103.1 tripartite ATP-independent transporter solute receptor, DctP family [Limimonas halophila]
MRKRFSFTATAGLAALALAAGFAAPAKDAQAETWKFALEEVDGSVQDAFAEKFAELVKEKSGGDITVSIFPYGQLGTSGDLTELVQTNAVQITNASPGHLGSVVEEMQVFSIPYLLSQNDEATKKVLDSADVIYDDLGDSLRKKGLEILTMYPEGEMVWTANKKITKPADFDGFKMRTMTSPLLTEAYKSFGATPTPMAYGEVYSALQLGTIDGQVNPIFAIQEMKFYEVQSHMIWAGQQEFTTSVVTGNDWYNGLSEEKRQILDESIEEATDYIFPKQREYNKERLEKIKEAKPELEMIRLSEEQRDVFRERAEQVRDKYVEMTGEDGKRILEKLTKAFEDAEAEVTN